MFKFGHKTALVQIDYYEPEKHVKHYKNYYGGNKPSLYFNTKVIVNPKDISSREHHNTEE